MKNKVLLPLLRLPCLLILLGSALLGPALCDSLRAAPIPRLYNTGVDDTGAVLGANVIDPHYRIIEIPEFVTVTSNAFTLVAGFPVGPWLGEGPLSRWIAPKANQSTGSDPGNYVYRTTFDLTGYDPGKATITGRWVSDNGGVDIVLNGVSMGLSNPGNFGGWTEANDFTLATEFVPGLNTLDFVVNNAGTDINPTGLRVEMRGAVELPDEAPSIVVQPQGRTVLAGEDVPLAVEANGTAPLSYQWRRNGAEVPGATDRTLLLAALSAGQEGEYTVVVRNAFGSQTSSIARVTVLEIIPGLHNTGVSHEGFVLDDGATDPHYTLVLNADGPGTEALVQDSTVFPIVEGPWIANSELSKWIGPRFETSAAAGGDYTYRLTVNLGDYDPATVIVYGSWATDNPGLDILVNGAGSGVQNTAGFGTLTPFTISSGFVSGTNTLEFKVRNEGAGYTGLRVEGLRAGGKKKAVTGTEPPRIVAQPQSQLLFVGDSLTLRIVADGTAPLNYQWKHSGQDLAGQTQSTLSIASAGAAHAGDYSVRVSNTAGALESAVVSVVILERIAGVFNTGVDATGAALEDGAVDPHYQLITNAQDPASRDAIVEDSTVFPIVEGPWLANTPGSKWIGPLLDPNAAGGDYVYRTTFVVDGLDPASIQLVGEWATDNVGTDILINGASTGIQNTAQFSAPTPFTISTGFKTGTNTVEFVINNAGAEANPTGLRILNLRAGGRGGSAASGIRLAVVARGAEVALSWTGGTPPYLVQKKTRLTDRAWVDLLTTSAAEVLVPREGESGFFRVQD